MKKLNLNLLLLLFVAFAFTSCNNGEKSHNNNSDVVVKEDKSTKSDVKLNGTFDINTEESVLEWIGKKAIGDSHNGKIQLKDGNFTVEDGEIVGGVATVDMTSISVDDIKDPEYNAKLTGHLSSEDFFNTSKYPTAKIEFTQGNNANELVGELTIKGITERVTFDADLAEVSGKPTITGTLVVDRTLYDIKYNSGKFYDNLGDKLINDEFKLSYTIVAK